MEVWLAKVMKPLAYQANRDVNFFKRTKTLALRVLKGTEVWHEKITKISGLSGEKRLFF